MPGCRGHVFNIDSTDGLGRKKKKFDKLAIFTRCENHSGSIGNVGHTESRVN